MKKWFQQKQYQQWWKKTKKGRQIGGGLLLMICLIIWMWGWFYQDRVLPNTKVAGYNISNLKWDRARADLAKLENDYLTNREVELVILIDKHTSDTQVINQRIKFDDLGVKFNLLQLMTTVEKNNQPRSWWLRWWQWWESQRKTTDLSHVVGMDEKLLDEQIANLAAEIDQPGAKAEIKAIKGGGGDWQVDVYAGENGWVLDQEQLKVKIKEAISKLQREPVVMPLSIEENVVGNTAIANAKIRAKKLINQQLTLELIQEKEKTNQNWKLTGPEMVGFIDFKAGFNQEKLDEYVQTLGSAVNRKPVNATFKFENGRVSEFAPSLEGIAVNETETVKQIMAGLTEVENGNKEVKIELPIITTAPEVNIPDVNNLGIKELIGKGVSTFKGSIPGRIHNVALTASRLNGVLVPPGEVFSFNNTVGDISRETGYQQAYIIKEGRTVLGDGGGVCQDSTTLFRAILDAGLPVIERKAHAYRVGYYEQNNKPGFDATVFAPSPDLKFRNDTGAYVLIQTKADTKALTLEVDLYGASDGRKAEITNYKSWDAVPAPPPLYQDDPTIPPGTTKQVDWAAPGLKVKYDYVVTRNGETIFKKTFYSDFQPWQAVYLRGV